MTETFFSTRQVALLLGGHRNTILKWCQAGVVRYEQVGLRPSYRIPQSEVERVAAERGIEIRWDRIRGTRRIPEVG